MKIRIAVYKDGYGNKKYRPQYRRFFTWWTFCMYTQGGRAYYKEYAEESDARAYIAERIADDKLETRTFEQIRRC